MEDDQTPEWVKRRKADHARANVEKIRTGGLQFFSELLTELERNANFLPQVGATGRVSYLSKPADSEQRCRVDVRVMGEVPGITYTDVFYRVPDNRLEERTVDGEVLIFRLGIMGRQSLGAVADGEFELLDAAGLAGRIVREALDRISSL